MYDSIVPERACTWCPRAGVVANWRTWGRRGLVGRAAGNRKLLEGHTEILGLYVRNDHHADFDCTFENRADGRP